MSLTHEEASEKGRMWRLSFRQRQLLEMLADGMDMVTIADVMGITLGTANEHRMRTLRKLAAMNATHAVATALRNGLIR